MLCAELLVPLAAKMSEEPFRLIIMDSVTANLRVDFTGRGTNLLAPCCMRHRCRRDGLHHSRASLYMPLGMS
jgi:hypothetical protein